MKALPNELTVREVSRVFEVPKKSRLLDFTAEDVKAVTEVIESHRSADVPRPNLTTEEAKQEIQAVMKDAQNDLRKAEQVVDMANVSQWTCIMAYAEKLNTAHVIWKANKLGPMKDFYVFMTEVTGKSKSSLYDYLRFYENRELLARCVNINEALAVLKGEAEPETPEVKKPREPKKPLTDSDIIARVEKLVVKYNGSDFEAFKLSIIEAVKKLTVEVTD